ncbi:hypothetical protein ZOSMA_101G00100 [Zostera marina]|uniref:Uncharacterized protein n=1 Tax=Zostera marina TaxID=29655 RepID=A0A0K9Q576_ZOSMR|nr:hypothetical protein ZOSMA_101G00100 [Zostera marina]
MGKTFLVQLDDSSSSGESETSKSFDCLFIIFIIVIIIVLIIVASISVPIYLQQHKKKPERKRYLVRVPYTPQFCLKPQEKEKEGKE